MDVADSVEVLILIAAVIFLSFNDSLSRKQRDEAHKELRRMKSGQPMSDKMARIIERLELEERIKKLKGVK